MHRAILSLTLLLSLTQLLPAADPPKVELLWPKGAPGAVGTEDADKPRLTVFLPPANKANGTAVVIIPGGGLTRLSGFNTECKQFGEWFSERGVTAFVLAYRLKPRYDHSVPLQDARRAIRAVRARAKEWNVDPDRIGAMGFSAGGYLAGHVGTDTGNPEADDPIDKVSCRPDFLILCYASLDPKQVIDNTPPTFLFHTTEDEKCAPENSINFCQALRKAKVPVEMHIYEKGRHGVGMAHKDPALSTWPDLLANWLEGRGLMRGGS